MTFTIPLSLMNFLFFQYKPELWQIGIIGTALFTESTPQLLEKFFRPFFGSFRVPSGKIIREVPFFSFLEPLKF